jgi:photosystem I P700 chlorophyll a apoprotein A1
MQSDMGTVNDAGVSHITGGNFAQSANTINGWLRDFLWAQSSRYSIIRFSIICVWFNFLSAHFVWAFSLMFLFSGRGYWQELIESILWSHNKLKVAPAIQPRALSITQGRAVGSTLLIRWYCNNVGILPARTLQGQQHLFFLPLKFIPLG